MARDKKAWCSQRGVGHVRITRALFAQPGTTLVRPACKTWIPARTTGGGCIINCFNAGVIFICAAVAKPVTFPDSARAAQFSHEPGASMRLRDYLDRWLKDIRPSLKVSTFIVYRRIVNHQIIDSFGDHALTHINWKDVRDWVARKDASAKTKGNILSVLRTALDDAVEDELIDANPLAGKKMRRKGDTKPRKDEIDPLSAEERAAILNMATGQEKNFLQFALWTGLRISELCALDWGDVDWVNKRIFVQRALTQHSKEPETPKTAAGERYVKLLPAALDALKAQKSFTFLKGEEIFCNPRTEKRWTGDLVIRERMWKRILLRAGVRYRYPYQMRHTYASMMLQAGESVMWVAQQMGHTDWTFTARTYSRWVSIDAPEAGSLAAQKWG
jgi:integrase